ncbi:MAG: hypothetical protein J5I93_15005 [Pirellulaceae bacterium]|nr:hypothetical protein [Pirellulaceae bacterium]
MTGLLVSVRSAAEAIAALDGGADVIDVKEPRAGSLGAAPADVMAEVVKAVGGRVPVSAALGELADRPAAEVPPGLAWAKVGLARTVELADWPTRWRDLFAGLPPDTRPVAVCYADWRSSAAPPPSEIVHHGGPAGCRTLLIDTWDKSRGDLFQWMTFGELQSLIELARGQRWLVVLAGSLRLESLPSALRLEPDLLAVRGAAAEPDRNGMIRAERVAELVRTIRRCQAALREA